MKKALFIVGPTASGKTELGLKLALKFNGAIVSADSVQVYKGLDVISGKDIKGKLKTPRPRQAKWGGQNLRLKTGQADLNLGFYEVDGIKIYLLDVVSPEYSFSVSDYVSIAKPTIETLAKQNILPIIVGGTGFYIKALLDGVDTISIPPNEKLRLSLDRKNIEELQILLKKTDSKKHESMNESDRKNKRRLIRAIEISEYLVANHPIPKRQKLEGHNVLIIGLHAKKETIKLRIDERVERRIEQGAFEEAERLFGSYDKLCNSVKNANGYKQLFEYLKDKVTKEEAVENWRRAEYINAKKQMTWFGKDERIKWFDITEEHFEGEMQDFIKRWLKQ